MSKSIATAEYRPTYPVVIVGGPDDAPELEQIAELDEEFETLDEAKAHVASLGYRVVDLGEGGNCETTDAWSSDRITQHVVTVDADRQ